MKFIVIAMIGASALIGLGYVLQNVLLVLAITLWTVAISLPLAAFGGILASFWRHKEHMALIKSSQLKRGTETIELQRVMPAIQSYESKE